MKLKLFMPTTSIAGGLFMLKRTKKPENFIIEGLGLFLLFLLKGVKHADKGDFDVFVGKSALKIDAVRRTHGPVG